MPPNNRKVKSGGDISPTVSNVLKTTDQFVYVEKSVTKKIADYESAKVTVGVQLPINPTKQQIEAAEAALDIALDIVDARIIAEVEDIMK